LIYTEADIRRETCIYGGCHQADDDCPRVPDHLDDLATPQARRMQRLMDDLSDN
jgi:hypothetical protein